MSDAAAQRNGACSPAVSQNHVAVAGVGAVQPHRIQPGRQATVAAVRPVGVAGARRRPRLRFGTACAGEAGEAGMPGGDHQQRVVALAGIGFVPGRDKGMEEGLPVRRVGVVASPRQGCRRVARSNSSTNFPVVADDGRCSWHPATRRWHLRGSGRHPAGPGDQQPAGIRPRFARCAPSTATAGRYLWAFRVVCGSGCSSPRLACGDASQTNAVRDPR